MSAHQHHAYNMLHGGAHSSVAAAGQGGCDPRFVSGSPPDLDLRSRATGAGTPLVYPAARFSGAFGSADAEFDIDDDVLKSIAVRIDDNTEQASIACAHLTRGGAR